MANPYGRPSGGFLEDYSLLAGAGSAFQGFAKGMEDAEDRNLKRQEFDAKMKVQLAEQDRHAQETAIKRRKDSPEALRQEEDLEYAKHNQEAIRDESGKTIGSRYKQEYKDMQTEKANSDPFGLHGYAAIKAKTEATQAQKGMKLPPDKVLSVQQGAQIPTMLTDIDASLKANKDLLGPLQGRSGTMNPYNESAQTFDAQLRTAAQTFGRYMEGGVLRKEDEEKYRKMFPQLSDTPEVAKNKLALVNKILVDKHNADIKALRDQGYDISGFSPLAPGKNPEVLSGKKGKKAKGGMVAGGLVPGGLVPAAEPKSGLESLSDDELYKEWQKLHPPKKGK